MSWRQGGQSTTPWRRTSFFDKTKGLLVQTLATAVRQRVTLGKLHNRRDTDDADTFWQHSTVTSR